MPSSREAAGPVVEATGAALVVSEPAGVLPAGDQKAAPVPRRPRSPLAKAEERRFYLFLTPWIIGFIFFGAGPLIGSIVLSLTNYSLLSAPKFVGGANYTRLFTDPLFYRSMVNTIYFGGASVALSVVFTLLIAILLNQQVRGLWFFRMVFYLPSVVAGIATALLWKNILDPDFGLINLILGWFGIQGPGWLQSPNWSIPGLVLMAVWGAGNTIVIYLAGLQSIPQHLYEAAQIDGANWWDRFRHVTIPMMSPVIFFNIITGLIGSLQAYVLILIMTQGSGASAGGPENSTLVIGLYIYKEAFQYFDFGYAAALSWALFVFIMIITLIQFVLGRRWVFYDSK
jgi:multiple sugar transport system permease protein